MKSSYEIQGRRNARVWLFVSKDEPLYATCCAKKTNKPVKYQGTFRSVLSMCDGCNSKTTAENRQAKHLCLNFNMFSTCTNLAKTDGLYGAWKLNTFILGLISAPVVCLAKMSSKKKEMEKIRYVQIAFVYIVVVMNPFEILNLFGPCLLSQGPSVRQQQRH